MARIPFNSDESGEQALQQRIKTLSTEVWDGHVDGADVDRWLSNFNGAVLPLEQERLHALNLLANFDFFGLGVIRGMLKSIYRDLFRYPIVQQARVTANGTRNSNFLAQQFASELANTRFLGMGNPSESGAHLLYYFRQINGLSKRLFIHQHEILTHAPGVANNTMAIPGLKRLVFIDDLMGSGTQAVQYSEKLLRYVREATVGAPIEICYFTLFARPDALNRVRGLPFDRVDTVHEIDNAELAFHDDSRVYRNPDSGLTLADGLRLAQQYGGALVPAHPLGYRNGQLLLGFEHNVPDNTLPIFWQDDTIAHWEPVFPRYNKVL